MPSMIYDDGMVKTTSLPEELRGDKDSEGLKPPADMKPLTNPIVDPSGTDTKYHADQDQSARLKYRSLTQNKGNTSFEESDNEYVFAAGEEINQDFPPTDEEAQSLPPNTDKPESSHTQDTDESTFDSSSSELKKYDNILSLTERQLVKYLRKFYRVLYNRITKDQWEKHEEAVVSYADLRASIEGYYEENVDHRIQTEKLVQATMNSLNKNSTKRANLLKALNVVAEILKVVQKVVKEDHALNKKVLEATEAYTANSNNIIKLLSLAKTFDFFGLKSFVKTVKVSLDAQNDHLET
ncbi:hypothetical protein Tco_1124229 [Tanacetum coccineum]|uniref:Uncharacterized protein n=1 Tax=Tanacetum coccineum TaxID=301880 RepID=A0ABQ5J9H4_9ASTR